MADHFETAKDTILLDAKANGGVEPHHILDALIALAADQDDAAELAARDRKGMKDAFTVHCISAQEQFGELESWRDGHMLLHKDHCVEVAAVLPLNDDGEPVARKVWLMWEVGRKVVYVGLALLIIVMGLFGDMIAETLHLAGSTP